MISAKLPLLLVDSFGRGNKRLGHDFTSPSPCGTGGNFLTYFLSCKRVLSSARPVHRNFWRDLTMEWTTPQHEEIDLNCEVSSYANAEL